MPVVESTGSGHPSRPSFHESDGRLCVDSQDGIYFAEEAGFRFTWCSVDLAGRSPELKAVLAAVDTDASFALPPHWDGPGLKLEILTEKNALDLEKGSDVAVVVTHDPAEREPGASTAYDSRIALLPGTVDRALPRRFSENSFRFSIRGKDARLTYQVTHSRRLVITMHLAGTENPLRTGIQRLPEISQELVLQALAGNTAASEIHFGRDDGFFEAAPLATVGSIVDFAVKCGGDDPRGTTLAFRGFLFPGSVLTFPCTLGEVALVSGDSVQTFSESDLERRFPPNRSVVQTESGLRANTDCWTTRPCTSRGIHPGFQRRPAGFLPACTISDLLLSEANPFGIFDNEELNPSGKFLELRSRLTCTPDNIVLRLDAEWIELGGNPVDPEHPLVLAGAADFFDQISVQEAAALRSLSPSSSVVLFDLSSGAETALRVPAAPRVTFSGVHKTGTIFRRVHSLLEGRNAATFHPHFSRGLRPDLAAQNAMSPGFPDDSVSNGPGTSSNQYPLRIAEILPQGSRGDDGVSHPGDEFIEFKGTAGCAWDGLVLEIQSADGPRTLILPPPCLPISERFVLFRNAPECFSGQDSAVEPGLVLPNAPAAYKLRSGEAVDDFTISPALYAAMERGLRTSASRSFSAESIVLTDGSASAAQYCPAKTRATPGSPESFRPFARLESPASGDHLRLRVFSGDGPVFFDVRIGRVESDASVIYQGTSASGSIIDIPLPASDFPRLLAYVTFDGPPAFLTEVFPRGSLLAVDEVSANPLPGNHEYVRVCSPGGFPGESSARGLFFKDRSAEDRIVPYQDRFGAAAGPLRRDTLRLLPGECALIVDPDTTSLPQLRSEDALLWTIATTSALGDGLSSGEGFTLFTRETDGSISPFATFGLPGTSGAFAVESGSGQLVRRIAGSIFDLSTNYEVIP